MRKILPAAALSLAMLGPGIVRAAEAERVVVTKRLYSTEGRFEMSLLGGVSFNNKLTEHYLGVLGLAYNTSDNWALELDLLGGYSRLNSVATQARDAIFQEPVLIGPPGSEVKTQSDDFADLWQLRYGALLLGRWNPVYGKVNIASELQVHFSFFFTAGGGALGLHKDSVSLCVNGPGLSSGSQKRGIDATCTQYLTENTIKPGAAVSAGFRFWMSKYWSLRAEVRDVAFLDSYRTKISRGDAEAGGDLALVSAAASQPGITNVAQGLLGVTVLF